jgi:hypothetical protein
VEMQSLHAAFNSQEEAESAIRKLSALRGDQFRLEKMPVSNSDAIFTDSAVPALSVEASSALGEIASPEALYSLSVHVPGSASEQARKVIRDAGGRLS